MPQSKHRRKGKTRPRGIAGRTPGRVHAASAPVVTLDGMPRGIAEGISGVIPDPIESFGPHDADARAFIERAAAAQPAEWAQMGDYGETTGTFRLLASRGGPGDRARDALVEHLPDVVEYLDHFGVESAHFGWDAGFEDAELASCALYGIVAQDWISEDDFTALTACARAAGWLTA